MEGALGHLGEHAVHRVVPRGDLLLAELDHLSAVPRETVAEEPAAEGGLEISLMSPDCMEISFMLHCVGFYGIRLRE